MGASLNSCRVLIPLLAEAQVQSVEFYKQTADSVTYHTCGCTASRALVGIQWYD
jgi:hypothetical protein